jgi:DNA-binding IclR family transcriptional regulator
MAAKLRNQPGAVNRGGVSTSLSTSVPRALALLELVLGADVPPTTTELAGETAIPSSTLAALIGGLRDLGYLVTEQGRHRPGPRLLGLGHLAGRHAAVVDAHAALELLVAETGETAFYSIEVDGSPTTPGRVLPVEQLESPDEIRYVGILGHATPLLLSAAGMALLAFSARDPATILAATPRADRPAELASPAKLRGAIAETRAAGFALLARETTAPLAAASAAAPVFRAGQLVGAFSVSGPRERIQALLPRLREAFAAAQQLVEHPEQTAYRPGQTHATLRWDPATREVRILQTTRDGQPSTKPV